MKLYLMRHGEASDSAQDSERPLTDKGREEVQRIADQLGVADLGIKTIYHSPMLRAQETAEIIAKATKLENDMAIVSGLNPSDPIEPLLDEIEEWQEDTLLIGHMPFMSHLASELVIEKERKQIISFACGSLVCLEKVNSQWIIEWAIRPNL